MAQEIRRSWEDPLYQPFGQGAYENFHEGNWQAEIQRVDAIARAEGRDAVRSGTQEATRENNAARGRILVDSDVVNMAAAAFFQLVNTSAGQDRGAIPSLVALQTLSSHFEAGDELYVTPLHRMEILNTRFDHIRIQRIEFMAALGIVEYTDPALATQAASDPIVQQLVTTYSQGVADATFVGYLRHGPFIIGYTGDRRLYNTVSITLHRTLNWSLLR